MCVHVHMKHTHVHVYFCPTLEIELELHVEASETNAFLSRNLNIVLLNMCHSIPLQLHLESWYRNFFFFISLM